MAEREDSDHAAAAFFRWQEWMAFRRQAVPATVEARADLYLAEARVLADATEPAAARDAASLALEHYNACETTESIRAKLQNLAEFTAGLGDDAESATAFSAEPATAVVANVESEIQKLERYLAGVSSDEALGLLKRINVVVGNAPMTTGYPFRMQPAAVMVPVRRPGATLPSWLHTMSNLRQLDPFRFRLMIELLKLKSAADSRSDAHLSDWLKGDELA